MLNDSYIIKSYKPTKIEFKNITFCVADLASIIIFIGDCSPKHCPNKKTTYILENIDDVDNNECTIEPLKLRLIDSKQVEIGQFKDKIKKLQFKERHYQNKTDQLLMEIDELKKKK
ncbi:hypothetical protein M9Y10_008001 [Tritrichomonas musculus]|uniref:Uncharacterized protein n=1 Tax=Tritrichomonas musculus TaxID=1915356 RepID=A0ABR2J3K9_9EUKA